MSLDNWLKTFRGGESDSPEESVAKWNTSLRLLSTLKPGDRFMFHAVPGKTYRVVEVEPILLAPAWEVCYFYICEQSNRLCACPIAADQEVICL